MLTGLILAAAITSHMPPGAAVVDHSQPSHYAQPTIRRFERRAVDDARKLAYKAYCAELKKLWKVYRSKGSTDEAFQEYVSAVSAARARYVIGDPYYAAFFDDGSHGAGCHGACCGGGVKGGAAGMSKGPIQNSTQK